MKYKNKAIKIIGQIFKLYISFIVNFLVFDLYIDLQQHEF